MQIKNHLIAFAVLLCSLPLNAQQAAKSVFQLTTYKKDGSVLSECHGFFIDNKGEAVAPWKPFVGADKAVVTETNGKKTEVKSLIGANEIYDICRFNTETTSSAVQLASAPLYALYRRQQSLWLPRTEQTGKSHRYVFCLHKRFRH